MKLYKNIKELSLRKRVAALLEQYYLHVSMCEEEGNYLDLFEVGEDFITDMEKLLPSERREYIVSLWSKVEEFIYEGDNRGFWAFCRSFAE